MKADPINPLLVTASEPGDGGRHDGQAVEIGDIVALVEAADTKPGKRGPYKVRSTAA